MATRASGVRSIPRVAIPADSRSSYAGGRLWQVPDTRRERLTVTGHDALLGSSTRAAAAPGVVAVRILGGHRSDVVRPVRGRVSPDPSRMTLPDRPWCGPRTLDGEPRQVKTVIHEVRAPPRLRGFPGRRDRGLWTVRRRVRLGPVGPSIA